MLILSTIIYIYTLILFGTVIISWLPIDKASPIVTTLKALTEPVLAPIRKVLPDMGGLDLSPIIAIVALQFLRRMLLG